MRYYRHYLTWNGTTIEARVAGWKDSGPNFQRHRTYYGIARSYSTKVRFPIARGFGGSFILSALDEEGIKAEIEYTRYRYNGQTNDYDLIYSAICDLKPETYEYNLDYVEVNFIDTAKESRFYENDEINFNWFDRVALNGNETFARTAKEITIPPFILYRQFLLDCDFFKGFEEAEEGSTTTNSPKRNTNIEIDETTNVSEDDEFLLYENKSDFDVELDIRELAASFEFNYLATIGSGNQMTFDLTLALNFVVFNSDDFQLSLTTLAQRFWDDITLTEGSYDEELTGNMVKINTGNITVPAGGRVDLRYSITTFINLIAAGPTLNYTSTVDLSNLEVLVITPSIGATTTKAIYTSELAAGLIASATGETDTSKLLRSTVFGKPDSEHSNNQQGHGLLSGLAHFNGFMVRKFPNASYNMNMRSLFKSMNALTPLGLSYDRVNDHFQIEGRLLFFKNDYMFSVSGIKNFSARPLPEMYFSMLKTGFTDKVEYETINGVREFNVPCEHAIDVPVKDKLDLQCNIHGDSFGVETARRFPYRNYATTDTKQDEFNFFLHCWNNEAVQGWGNPTGMIGIDYYYNINFSPRENLLRHKRFISVPMWKQDRHIKFINSQKNINFEYTNYQGARVNQLDDIEQGEMTDAIIFTPMLHKFEAPVTQNMIDRLNEDPHGYMDYPLFGQLHQGYIHSAEVNSFQRMCKFEIIPRGTFSDKILATGSGDILLTGTGQQIKV